MTPLYYEEKDFDPSYRTGDVLENVLDDRNISDDEQELDEVLE